MKQIKDRVKNVVDYNDVIREHIENLSASFNKLSKYVEKALEINTQNRKKTYDTKIIMDNLLIAVKDIEKN